MELASTSHNSAEPQSIHEYVIKSLQSWKGRWPKITQATGISRRHIEKIANRTIPNPGVKTVEVLAQFFRDQP